MSSINIHKVVSLTHEEENRLLKKTNTTTNNNHSKEEKQEEEEKIRATTNYSYWLTRRARPSNQY